MMTSKGKPGAPRRRVRFDQAEPAARLPTRAGKAARRVGSFVVVELLDRRSGLVHTVHQEIGGALRCSCGAWRAAAAAGYARPCRHVEIVETARTLAAAWVNESNAEKNRILRLTPPPGDAAPTRLYDDSGQDD